MNALADVSPHTQQLIARLQSLLPELSRDYGVKSVWLFGSRVRGEESESSDIDILVEFDERPLTLLQFVHLENYLSDILGMDVDLVERESLKPNLGKRILAEALSL